MGERRDDEKKNATSHANVPKHHMEMSPAELREPLIDDLDDLRRVSIVKMIPSIDQLIG